MNCEYPCEFHDILVSEMSNHRRLNAIWDLMKSLEQGKLDKPSDNKSASSLRNLDIPGDK